MKSTILIPPRRGIEYPTPRRAHAVSSYDVCTFVRGVGESPLVSVAGVVGAVLRKGGEEAEWENSSDYGDMEKQTRGRRCHEPCSPGRSALLSIDYAARPLEGICRLRSLPLLKCAAWKQSVDCLRASLPTWSLGLVLGPVYKRRGGQARPGRTRPGRAKPTFHTHPPPSVLTSSCLFFLRSCGREQAARMRGNLFRQSVCDPRSPKRLTRKSTRRPR